MTITFHGAARCVTGSKHLLKLNNGKQLLLDCGLFQGMGEDTEGLNGRFGFDPRKVDYMVLSHAHIDHSGLIPRLVSEGFKGTIFCTAPTMDLSRILLMDSARIQQQDAEDMKDEGERKGRASVDPLYTEEDVIEAMRLFKIIEYNTDFEIDPRLTIRLTDAGHILGSAAVHLSILEDAKNTNITFSGDVGRYGDLLLKNPQSFPQADYIILESTYGDSYHKDVAPLEDQLKEIIHQTCLIRRGKVVIPAFSVGRTQELLYALNSMELKGALPEVDYYVDSPLSEKATEVLKGHPHEYNKSVKEVMQQDDDIFKFKGLKFIQSPGESKALNEDPRPCVIISSSGMAESGRVKHHIRNALGNEKNTILMVGYCEPSSLAGCLMRGEKEVSIFGTEYDVKAEVRAIKSLSAHGDCEDLLKFLSCQDPQKVKKVFLVHGEYEVQSHFKALLEGEGYKEVLIPRPHQMEEL